MGLSYVSSPYDELASSVSTSTTGATAGTVVGGVSGASAMGYN